MLFSSRDASFVSVSGSTSTHPGLWRKMQELVDDTCFMSITACFMVKVHARICNHCMCLLLRLSINPMVAVELAHGGDPKP